jgi:drug/metabolite transporter (DMT)-like permease
MARRRLWSGKALLVVSAWGASFVATRMALAVLTPFALVAIRLAIGGGLLVALGRLQGRPVLPPREGRAAALLLGLVVAVHLLIQAVGLRYTSAVSTGWIVGFIPVTIALGARLFLGQRLGAVGWLGVAVATTGVLLVTARPPAELAQAHLGDLLQLVSCVTWTAYTLLAVRPVARHGSLVMTATPMLVAAGVVGLGAAADRRLLVAPPTLPAVVAVAFLAVVCSGVAYLLWLSALDEIGPARTGVYLYLEPFVTLATAAALLGERVTPLAVAGGCAVLLGVVLVQAARARSAVS